MNNTKTLTEEQIAEIIDMIGACGIFTTPIEMWKNWNEYKQDAFDRLKKCKEMLSQEE